MIKDFLIINDLMHRQLHVKYKREKSQINFTL